MRKWRLWPKYIKIRDSFLLCITTHNLIRLCKYSHYFTKILMGKSRAYTAIYSKLVIDGMTWVTLLGIVSAVLISIHRSTLNQRITIVKFLNSVEPSHRLMFRKLVTPFVSLFPVRMRLQGQDLQIARGALLNSVSINFTSEKNSSDTDLGMSRHRGDTQLQSLFGWRFRPGVYGSWPNAIYCSARLGGWWQTCDDQSGGLSKIECSEKGHTSTGYTVPIFKASKLALLRLHLLVPSVWRLYYYGAWVQCEYFRLNISH